MTDPHATTLSTDMRKLADAGHARADELRAAADKFDAACARMAEKTPDPEKTIARGILGAWARAVRIWCECTGEPLL